MHKIKVLALGPKNFNISLDELKEYLSFDLAVSDDLSSVQNMQNFKVLLIHEDYIYKNSNDVKKIWETQKISVFPISPVKGSNKAFLMNALQKDKFVSWDLNLFS